MIRLAIYFTPEPNTSLAREAAMWFGRDSHSIIDVKTREPLYITTEIHQEIIQVPFHYGFHGTIKPPFKLVEGATVNQVAERLRSFVKLHRSFVLPPLKLSLLGGFFCLRQVVESRTLSQLAAHAVEYFDDFRLSPDQAELARRRSAGLTDNQDKMLMTWGYPYVMDEFRFHLTLTGRIIDFTKNDDLRKELQTRFPPEGLDAVDVSSLSLFIEENGEPLYCIERFPLG